MERRLIDANALGVYKYVTRDAFRGFIEVIPYGLVLTAPTISAVEVVRCRECAYMHVPRCCPCQISGFKVDDDWYCPMGVRREPDGK